jgi:hypothetical protein
MKMPALISQLKALLQAILRLRQLLVESVREQLLL